MHEIRNTKHETVPVISIHVNSLSQYYRIEIGRDSRNARMQCGVLPSVATTAE